MKEEKKSFNVRTFMETRYFHMYFIHTVSFYYSSSLYIILILIHTTKFARHILCLNI